MADLARLCDAFYIGGTKVGALFGEALVLTHPALKEDFRYLIKQHGGMLAKGRLLGIQFETLFEDGLYDRISDHALQMADILRDALTQAGFAMQVDSPTNQLFPIVPDALGELCRHLHEPGGREFQLHPSLHQLGDQRGRCPRLLRGSEKNTVRYIGGTHGDG